jgi:D-xylose transport system substrate-binding protein
VGSLLQALYNGSDVNALTNGATVATFDGGNIPAVLDAPITVDSGNIASTVIADNYITKDEVCVGIAKGTMGVC